MSLTTVIALVGGVIATAESVSALLAYLDSKKQRRLDDVALVLQAQQEATHLDVVALLSKDAADLAKSEREYLRGILERCEVLIIGLERERGGKHLGEAKGRADEALERLRTKVAEAPVTEPASVESAGAERRLVDLATAAGLSQRPPTTAYTPFGKGSSGKHLLLLTPREKYLLARFRIPDGGASSAELLDAGFDVSGYSKDGFYSLRLTDDDLGDAARHQALEDLLVAAARG